MSDSWSQKGSALHLNISPEACSPKNRLSVFPITPQRKRRPPQGSCLNSESEKTRPSGFSMPTPQGLDDLRICMVAKAFHLGWLHPHPHSQLGTPILPPLCPLPPPCHAPRGKGLGASLLGIRSEGEGSLLPTSLISLPLSCSPHSPSSGAGERPLTLQPTAPESPHLWLLLCFEDTGL